MQKKKNNTPLSRLARFAASLFVLLRASAALAFEGKPTLSITIPTIKFTDLITKVEGEGTYLYIPWLAQYIVGLYKYALGIAIVIAVVMIVIGGFQYVTGGGDASRVGAGKKRISEAVIGLVLLYASYSILATVSPNLLSLNAIRILQVKKDPFISQDFDTMFETKTDTTEAPVGTDETSTAEIPPKFTTCPVELTQEGNFEKAGKVTAGHDPRLSKDPRLKEFLEKIRPVLTGPTVTDKLQQAGEAAKLCSVHFGSCGQTAGAIYALAGVGDSSCLEKDKGCSNHERAEHVLGLSSSAPLRKVLCSHKEKCCQQYKDCKIDNAGCTEDQGEAIRRVAADMKIKYPGYPDAWAAKLRPGDIIWVYNANSDCGGQHSAMFIGWGTGGKANVIQGAWGHNAKGGSICVKSSCGTAQQAMTQILRGAP